MTLEIYKYIQDRDACVGYQEVIPGDYVTLINRQLNREDEVIVANCRPDNKLSYIFTIHPQLFLMGLNPPQALYDDEDTENRVLLVRLGEEQIVSVRERVVGDEFIMARYRFSHR